MSQCSLPSPLHRSRRPHSIPCIDPTPSPCLVEQHRLPSFPASTATASSIYSHFHSSPRFKDSRFRPQSSSSSPSAELLAPVPNNFKRRRHPRLPLFATLLRSRSEGDRPALSPACFILDQADDRPSSTPAAAAPTASKFCAQKTILSAKCASIATQQSDAIDSTPSKWRRTLDLQCVEALAISDDDNDVDKEEARKLIMWRAACAMAHAYVHRHDQHRHDVHQQNRHAAQHELSFHTPHSGQLICNVALNAESKHGDRPLLQESDGELRSVTKHVNDPLATSSAPPATSSKDGVRASSMFFLSDVVRIDEVVNPTQAAEWFGTLFSSASTLVS